MTPENRARLHSVIRESLTRAVLPASTTYQRERAATHGPFSQPSAPAPFKTVLDEDPNSIVNRFRREAENLAVNVYLARDEDEATATVMGILKAVEATRVLAWAESAIGLPGLPQELTKAKIETVSQEVPFDLQLRPARLAEMASAQAGITGAAAGLADSGSLVLSHGPSRGRLASLLPPVHIAVLRRSAIIGSFAELLEKQPSLPEVSSNLVLITGPSRTADIEMTLSRGVHGPKDVHIILV
jgi:L-lactate dehydrogenase complex protein LldG